MTSLSLMVGTTVVILRINTVEQNSSSAATKLFGAKLHLFLQRTNH